MILAYEPVWAIGTGETASIKHINEIHGLVKSKLSKLNLDIPVLYGGSVNPNNSNDILFFLSFIHYFFCTIYSQTLVF